jgi:hypothetical protein
VKRTALGIAIVLVAYAGGCGSDDGSNTVTETKTVSGPAATTAESGAKAEAASLQSAKPSGIKPAVAKLYEFVSPSRNIGCILDPKGARCDIREHAWKDPPKPASCEFDWGGNLQVFGNEAGHIGCVSDSAAGGKDVLAYGTYVQNPRLRCTSEASGMTCKNLRTGHGFFVSREQYHVF